MEAHRHFRRLPALVLRPRAASVVDARHAERMPAGRKLLPARADFVPRRVEGNGVRSAVERHVGAVVIGRPERVDGRLGHVERAVVAVGGVVRRRALEEELLDVLREEAREDARVVPEGVGLEGVVPLRVLVGVRLRRNREARVVRARPDVDRRRDAVREREAARERGRVPEVRPARVLDAPRSAHATLHAVVRNEPARADETYRRRPLQGRAEGDGLAVRVEREDGVRRVQVTPRLERRGLVR